MASNWSLDKNILCDAPGFVAVNKPAGLLSIPDRFNDQLPSLSSMLQKRFGEIFTVHRLDRDTSGVILFAKTREAHRHLSHCFETRLIRKDYLVMVGGQMPTPRGRIDLPLSENNQGKMIVVKKGKAAITDYEVKADFTIYSLLGVRILTGRTHQIRVHLKSAGHPVLCDDLYGSPRPIYLSSIKRGYRLGKSQEEEKPLLSRLALHASRLSFPSPEGIEVTLEAPLARDLNALVSQLEKQDRSAGPTIP